jgi:tRNA(fMet)-specific endonuclease VapC
MAQEVILLDTSILIDFYRKKDKEKTVWYGLLKKGLSFCISAVTKYEIYMGSTTDQMIYWNNVLKEIVVLPFDSEVVDKAVEINQQLKRKRKQIDMADLFIASTALANGLPISTLNKSHFERIEGLRLV